MERGRKTLTLEAVIHADPVTVHKHFLTEVWWKGGLPWYANGLATKVVQPAADEAGTGGIRQVPLGIEEEILEAELGKYIEYTLKRKRWFPVSYHRGRVDFYEAGPNCTRVVWRVNYNPYFYAPPILAVSFFFLGQSLLILKKFCEKGKKTSYFTIWSLLQLLLGCYVLFMLFRFSKLSSFKPQHPGEEYLKLTDRFREETGQLDSLLQKQKYLIIGGGGFTGSALVDDLRKRGVKDIRVMGRSFPPIIEYPYGPTKSDRYPLPGVEYSRGDLTDFQALQKAMKGIDVVFHTAISYGSPAFGSLRGAEIVNRTNIDGAENVYEAARESKTVKQIIFTSSCDTVFTDRALHRVNETHPYLAYGDSVTQYAEGKYAVGDHYARSKIVAEKYLLAQDNKHGIRIVSLRPNGIYGPGENVLFKRALDLPYVLGFIPFYFDEVISDYSCVYNLVYAHVLASYKLSTDPNRVGGKAYFITDDETVNLAEWAVFVDAIQALVPLRFWLHIPSSLILAPFGHLMEVIEKFLFDNFSITIPMLLNRKEAMKITYSHSFNNDRARADLGYKPLFTTKQCRRLTAEETTRRYSL